MVGEIERGLSDTPPLYIGVDEAGRGPLAGPVFAAAVCLPAGGLEGLDDSKRLSEKSRAALFEEIKAGALAWSITAKSPGYIDRVNIRRASLDAMRDAARDVLSVLLRVSEGVAPRILVDGRDPVDPLPVPGHGLTPVSTYIKGDARSFNIAAASILAKVSRDAFMVEMADRFPGYGFAQHKGYPTKRHKQAIAEKGPCILHRRSFKGVREHVEREE